MPLPLIRNSSKSNLKTRSNGFSVILLIILVFIAFVASLMLMIYFLKDQISLPPINLKQEIKQQFVKTPLKPEDPATKGWQELNIASEGITVKFPPNWQQIDDHSFAQFASPVKFSSKIIANSVNVTTHTGVLYEGYYDQDLFEKLYNLKADESFSPDYFNQNSTTIYNLSHGTIRSGQRYILTSLQKNGVTEDNITCYILKNGSLVILNLSRYDDFGLETFKKIIETTVLN